MTHRRICFAGAEGNDASDEEDPQAAFGSTHTPSFVRALDVLGCSLLVSTYQSGRIIAFRVVLAKTAILAAASEYSAPAATASAVLSTPVPAHKP